MTDTPRTDAAVLPEGPMGTYQYECVSSELVRKLEHELADILDAAQGVLDFAGQPLERDREAYEAHAAALRAAIREAYEAHAAALVALSQKTEGNK